MITRRQELWGAAILAGVALGVLWHRADLFRFVCDDAYISFRYARNLLLGRGLVFNVGERVEGYTNLLWVLEIAAAWWAGVDPAEASMALGKRLTVGSFGLVVILAARSAPAAGRWVAIVAASALFACNRSVAIWSTSGLETRQFTFLFLLGLTLLTFARRRAPWLMLSSTAFGLAELTRPEAPLLVVACGLGWLLVERQQALQRRVLVPLIAPFVLVTLGHYLWRYGVYGEWLPNTYYAKHVRPWPEAGERYLAFAAIECGVFLTLPLAAAGLVAALRRGRGLALTMGMITMAVHALYQRRIGGDHFEFRTLDLYWPILAVGAGAALAALHVAAARQLCALRLPSALAYLALLGVTMSVVAVSTAVERAHEENTAHLLTYADVRRMDFDIDPAAHPLLAGVPGLASLVHERNALQRYLLERKIAVRWKKHKHFAAHRLKAVSAYASRPQLFGEGLVASSGTVGVIPFLLPNLTVIDENGLTDKVIARHPVTIPNEQRRMAHDRSPPPGYLRARGVNVVVHYPERRLYAFSDRDRYGVKLADDLWAIAESPAPRSLEVAWAGKPYWFHRLRPRIGDNRVVADGHRLRPLRALGLFDGDGYDGWTLSGAPLSVRPLPGRRQARGRVGPGLLDTYNHRAGDRLTVKLTSPTFVAGPEDWLVFLIAGGGNPRVGLELLAEGERAHVWRGEDEDRLQLRALPLRELAGRTLQLRLFDHTRLDWGHIVVDHVMLMREGR